MTVGSHVRLLSIPASVTRPLPPEDVADLRSMIGVVFEVYEIDEWGQEWVQQHWSSGDGQHRYHSLGLDLHEMECAEATNSPSS